MKHVAFIIVILPLTMSAQSLTLAECYTLAEQHSPLAGKRQLLSDQSDVDKHAIKTALLPQFELAAKATYQSDVTAVPLDLPNADIEPVNKDQYAATFTAQQVLYDGGTTHAALGERDATTQVRRQEVQVRLHQLRFRVNQYFFSALLAQDQLAVLEAKKELLEAREAEIHSGVAHGILDKSSAKVVEVELLQIGQKMSEVEQAWRSSLQSLFALTGMSGTPLDITLAVGEGSIDTSATNGRPELMLFDYQREGIRAQAEVVSRRNNPTLSAFATAGYGNPALNMLENAFRPYYIVGLNARWNPFDWNATRKRQESLRLEGLLVEREKAHFDRDMHIELDRLSDEMSSLQTRIAADEHIIRLREDILKTREAQLQNGVITSAEYVDALTEFFEAKAALSTHRTQLLYARANYHLTKGI